MRSLPSPLAPLLLSILLCTCVRAQTVPLEVVHPDTLRAPDDSLRVYFSSTQEEARVNLNDPGSYGTDGQPGRRLEVRTTVDMLLVASVNTFHDQHLLIPIIGRTDTFLYRLRFNGTAQPHPVAYRSTRKGTAVVEIPEVFELANVILYLSALSDSTGNHPRGTAYTERLQRTLPPSVATHWPVAR